MARGVACAALAVGNLALAAATGASAGAGLFDPHRRLFCAICAVLTAILLAGLYVPGAAGVFHFAAPSPALLAAGLGVGVAAGGWSGVLRALGRRRVRLRSDP